MSTTKNSNVGELLTSLPRHPQDNRIVIGANLDPIMMRSLVSVGHVKAALITDFIPVDEIKRNLALGLINEFRSAGTEDPLKLRKNRMSWMMDRSGGQIGHRVSYMSDGEDSLYCEVEKPSKVPWVLAQMKKMQGAVEADGPPKSYFNVEVNHVFGQRGSKGLNYGWHSDNLVVSHITLDGGLLQIAFGNESEEQVRANACPKIGEVPIGTLAIFNKGLVHRTSPNIPELGQLMMTAIK